LTTSTPRSPASRPSRSKTYGHVEPRICVPAPLRDLDDPAATLGHAAGKFAETIGQPFLPHEQCAANHQLELDEDTGLLRFRFVLFGAARQNSKTHYSRIMAAFRMLMATEPQQVLGCSQDLGQSLYALNLCHSLFRAQPWLYREVANFRRANGQQELLLRNGSSYVIRAANGEAGRGLTCHLCIFDELRTQQDSEGFAAATSTINAARNAQVLCLSNAGSDKSTVLNDLTARGLAGGPDSRLLVMLWTPPPGRDLHDIDAWKYGNPAMGYGGIQLENLEAAFQALDPAVFRTEVMNERVVALNTAIDLEAWRGCADVRASLDAHRGRVVCAFDSFGQHSVLAVAADLGGVVRIEIVKHWDSIPEARTELGPLLDRIQPRKLGWFPGAGAAFAAVLRGRRGSTEISGAGIAEACMGFADAVASRQVSHGDSPLLNAHVGKAERLDRSDGYIFGRRGSHGSITGCYAAAGAYQLVASGPRVARARIRSFDINGA
jgi:hypothetical protein